MSKKEKVQWVVIGLIILATAVFLLLRKGGDEEETRIWITRPESGTKKETVALQLGEDAKEWTLEVDARKRTEEEISNAFSESVRILNEFFGIRNGESGKLTESVSLPEYIEETGVTVRWNSSDGAVITKDGKVNREQLKEVCEVNMQARMNFAEEECEHWFAVKVPPYEVDSEEALLFETKERLRALEKDTSEEDGFYLPEEVGPVVIGRPEESGSLVGILVVAVLFLPFALIITKHQEKEKKRKKRAEELLAEYPRLVTKLTLYTGAGLSLRGAWERLATEYREKEEKGKKKSALGEEICILAGELKNGTSEAKAYETLGRRIALRPYLRCASILVSQLQKGSGGLRKNLENEVQLAWEMYREQAAKKGEEAQTKLLFPMMGMMFLVMAVIMIPAFFTM